ncbi:oxidoreductase [Pantoea rodasii]|uniref:Oxidoreductase n=1 Tax=Pantoea rodasii TaxID=1076549 RepID=A0A2M9WEV5_9GAMM|nr:oxidoreductase [Pantoea rodasii]ORM57697.1 oxidoreductase [Pantoea rodasii]PJZ06062.1 oxidoreductase [Pantoea rodasii]
MEQRRSPGHDHWFYESQTRPHTHTTAPLVPEAAHIEDRFLLGLQQEASALQPLFSRFQPAFLAARDISQILFPDALNTSLTHTLTLYDRLSTALTVAQVAGVQRLCNHYSARLNPLPGPDSSRESNNRLTQITQYARQLAMQPALINANSISALDAVGLTEPDIVTLNQLVGFVSFQARVVAALQALMGLPVRWIPGVSPPADADVALFSNDTAWQHALKPVELRYASAEQLAAITFCQGMEGSDDAVWLLVHDAQALYGWATLQQRLAEYFGQDEALAQAVSARILGCQQQFAQHAGDQRDTLLRDVDKAGEDTPPISVSAQLVRLPERFSAAHLQPLLNAGWGTERIFTLLLAVAFASWQDRVLMALGEAR